MTQIKEPTRPKRIKIAVYSIFKNEEKFAARWLDSAMEADYIFALDTGSTDETAKALADHYDKLTEKKYFGIPTLDIRKCSVVPFRFDDARNFSLHWLPADIDICICLDFDEVLVPGWRHALEESFKANPTTTRWRYNYVWSWNADKTPGLTYFADKIHTRGGYRWAGPVHEVARRDPRSGPEVQTFINATLIEHYPDNTKPRSQYLPLLELAVKENQLDDRMAHYLGREYHFAGRHREAIAELKRHLDLPSATWNEERAASWRYIGDSFWALGEHKTALNCFYAAQEEGASRENCVRLAQAYRALGEWGLCKSFAEKALEFKTRPNCYINDAVTWSDWPDRMLAEALEKLAGAGKEENDGQTSPELCAVS